MPTTTSGDSTIREKTLSCQLCEVRKQKLLAIIYTPDKKMLKTHTCQLKLTCGV